MPSFNFVSGYARPSTAFALSPGDRCQLTPDGARFYGGVAGKWVSETQGGTYGVGTVLRAGYRLCSVRPYYVRWDNGEENSYREEDIYPAQ